VGWLHPGRHRRLDPFPRRQDSVGGQPAIAEGAGKVVDGSERAAVDRLSRLAGSARLFRSSDGRLFGLLPLPLPSREGSIERCDRTSTPTRVNFAFWSC
jgi:hypothetical protein